ncbi:ABC transporter substrate-binding protein [Bordetella bronchiseptica]|uniref:ABC transporter substrate-binding protein n=1 Tax=Bordetella bronchiseptica TaxID=518 RepID=UPI00028A5213|nr:ABC transporter substrate-binding protein [Bordetella bronchiseptica]KCV27664.1 receptor family ligand-binding protein [Bordetella bronchiseptica 00-P-2730]KDD57197.1 receptor family ligand-binding protein [Bordetella bronchiseptica OSU553]AUL17268.1 ABC transporter substrate-binding protein [Bordetella bronchiseptica]AWP60501.1 ABC transporter substrate-binding protein [Bordetella bronchiseptica]AWQ07352.1 ABC transporter substrate-binding protein [Bordetella bronchiseptica]
MRLIPSLLAALALAPGLANADPIKVGIANDISGPFAALGAEARDGFNLAIKELGGKLGGQQAEFLQTDMGGNPDQARQLVTRYIQREKVDFFTGPIGSNVALAVGPALFAAKIPYLSNNPGPSQYAGAQCNKFWFGNSYQNDAFHEAAGKVAADRGYKKVLIMAPDYPAGKDALTGFKRGYKTAVAEELYTKLGQIDYAAELAQIRAAKPDAVYIFLPGGMGINFVKQFVSTGLAQGTALVGPGFSADEDVIQAVGEPMLGMVNTAQWAHDLDVPQNKKFVEAFRKEYNGRYPSVYAAQAYDVIMSIDAAVKQAGGKASDRDAIVKALEQADYPSVRGSFTYGKNHYPIQAYYARVVEKDGSGRITNKLTGKVFDKYQDVYVGDCKL